MMWCSKVYLISYDENYQLSFFQNLETKIYDNFFKSGLSAIEIKEYFQKYYREQSDVP